MKQGPHDLAAMILDQAKEDHPSDPVEVNVSVVEYMAMALVAAIELTCAGDVGKMKRILADLGGMIAKAPVPCIPMMADHWSDR